MYDKEKQIDDKFEKGNFDNKEDHDEKKVIVANNEDSKNNSVIIEHPKTLFDLEEAALRLREIRQMRVDNKDISLQDEENALTSYLCAGIILEEIPYHEDIIISIKALLEPYGYNEDNFVEDNLRDLVGHVCPLNKLDIGYAQALRSHIDMDIDFFEYDSDGKVVGVEEDKVDLYKYVVMHEFFHKLSSYKNGHGDVGVMGGALLEGYTDMLAHRASGNYKDKSACYDFSVRVCEMFTEMMGMAQVLYDYIDKTGENPNLRNLFKSCGLDDECFLEFSHGLDMTIEGVKRDSKLGLPSSKWALPEKTSSLDFLRDNIVIPYCRNNPDKATSVLGRFNELFQDMGYNCSMEDVKGENKSK